MLLVGRKNGCPESSISRTASSLDIIRFFPKQSQVVIEEIGPLYAKGLSISDISDQTGIKRGAIWRELKKHQKTLRSQDPVPFSRWRKGRGKTKARPPFGFSYLEGEVIRDPREYPQLKLILGLWNREISLSDLQRTLAEKKIKSRTGKAWSYNVLKAAVTRSYTNLPLDPHLRPKKFKN